MIIDSEGSEPLATSILKLRDLATMSVADLGDYIRSLEEEIMRACTTVIDK